MQNCRAGASPANSKSKRGGFSIRTSGLGALETAAPSPLRVSADQVPSGLSSTGALMDTRDMNITRNIGMLLLAIYLIAVGILTLTGLGIITGVLALLAGIFILIGR